MSGSNGSPFSDVPANSPPPGEPVEGLPAVPETPVEVVSTGIHYPAPPPPYSAVKNAPIEPENLLKNSITITIKCPSFIAERQTKAIIPIATLTISFVELVLLLIGMEGWPAYATATSLAAILLSLAASALLAYKPISAASSSIYGPLVNLSANSVLAIMQLCNVALSFYFVGVQYWRFFVFIVNGILSLLATLIACVCVANMLLTSRQEAPGSALLPVEEEDAEKRSMYWKEIALLSFVGAVLLLDEDEGQYVMFAFLVCVVLASTAFTFPSSLLLGLVETCDVAHLELSGATSVAFVGLLNVVYSSFLMPAVGYLSEIRLVALRTEIVISILLMVCALQIVVHIVRRVRVVQDAEEISEEDCAGKMPDERSTSLNVPL